MFWERAVHLKINIPDASVMWDALLSMAEHVLTIDKILEHRIQQSRIELEVDTRPTMDNISAMYELLLSEFDLRFDIKTVADPGVDGVPKGEKERERVIKSPTMELALVRHLRHRTPSHKRIQKGFKQNWITAKRKRIALSL